MNEKRLHIEYKYSLKEAIIIGKEFSKSTNNIMRFAPYMGWIFLAFFIFMWIIMKHFPNDNFFTLIFGLIFTSFPFLIIQSVKRGFKKNQNANNTYYFTIDNNSIEVKIGTIESKCTWKNIQKVEKRKKGYLLFTQPRAAYWIPNSAMNEESIKILHGIIKDNNVKYR